MPDFQSIGGVLTGASATVSLVLAISNRAKFGTFMRSREATNQLIKSLEADLGSALKETDSSRRLAHDYQGSLDAITGRFDEYKESTNLRIAQIEEMRPRFIALVAWSRDVMIYIVWLEGQAKINGVDLGGRSMPPLPKILSDLMEMRP